MPRSRDQARRRPEGWAVAERPALLGGLILFVVLFVALVGLGSLYRAGIGARTAVTVSPFPAPRLVTRPRDAGDSIVTPADARREAGIRRAMAAIAAEGDAFWAVGGQTP